MKYRPAAGGAAYRNNGGGRRYCVPHAGMVGHAGGPLALAPAVGPRIVAFVQRHRAGCRHASKQNSDPIRVKQMNQNAKEPMFRTLAVLSQGRQKNYMCACGELLC